MTNEPEAKGNEAPLTEPVAVNDVFITGILVEELDGHVRITGYAHISKRSGEMDERRIVVRMVLPLEIKRDLLAQLKRGEEG